MKTLIGIAIGLAAAGGLSHWFLSRRAAAGIDEIADIDRVEPVGPVFNADSAMLFCHQQCQFGPRVMNSEAHDRCRQWIVDKFRSYGLDVEEQRADLTGYDGTTLHATNIIARTPNPDGKSRVMLCAHWDSRPWADNDPDSANWHKPVLAANDGASGVAVMLEVARAIQRDTTLRVAVEFVCFDAEDWGTPQWAETGGDDSGTWALGAQYWAEHASGSNADIRYALLLDMVGGQGAHFYQEQASQRYAPDVVKKVWRAARKAGYGSFFPNRDGGYITDDHIPVNEKAAISCIDIIAYYPDCQQSSFGPTWHTVSDDMAHLDVHVLKAVGQTVIQTLYTEEE